MYVSVYVYVCVCLYCIRRKKKTLEKKDSHRGKKIARKRN